MTAISGTIHRHPVTASMHDKPTRHRQTPADAKRLAYERDCVNQYGENDKASRKAIRRFKAASHRTERHAEGEILRQAVALDLQTDENLEQAETRIAEARFQGRHPWRRKTPDVPLGVALDQRRVRTNPGEAPTANRRAALVKAIRLRAPWG